MGVAEMIAAFEQHYDTGFHDPALRNERLSWIAAWNAANAWRSEMTTNTTAACGADDHSAPSQDRPCPPCGACAHAP